MKKYLLISLIVCCCASLMAQAERTQKRDYWGNANYDEEKIPAYTLPDLLTCEDGSKVTSVRMWEEKRRGEIFRMFETYMFGKIPATDRIEYTVTATNEKALDGKAIKRLVTIKLAKAEGAPELKLQIYVPKQKLQKKVPVFLGISFQPNDIIDQGNPSWQLDKILANGYGLATFCYTDVVIDKDDSHTSGIQTFYYTKGQSYPRPDEWGDIAAWAWGMSKVMDYLETDDLIDNSKVAIIGHSRLGKAVLWAGALDQRFAMVIPVNSGCSGNAISRRRVGETVEAMNISFPHWFCDNYKQFNAREDFMPFDQHMLVALSAPRPIYLSSAEDDKWSDPKGEYLGAKCAEPAYLLYGLKGLGCDDMPAVDEPHAEGAIAYHIRKGPHAVLEYDWEQYLKFAGRYFK